MTPRLTSDAARSAGSAPACRDAVPARAPARWSSRFASSGGDRRECWRRASTGAAATRLDSWIAIGADGIVTAYTGKCEFGQGLYTAQMQLVAEELGVPIEPRHA